MATACSPIDLNNILNGPWANKCQAFGSENETSDVPESPKKRGRKHVKQTKSMPHSAKPSHPSNPTGETPTQGALTDTKPSESGEQAHSYKHQKEMK